MLLLREQGRSGLLSFDGGPRMQVAWFSARSWAHGCCLPMPSDKDLDAMESETHNLPVEGDPGPKAQAWLKVVEDWVYHLELWFRGTSSLV